MTQRVVAAVSMIVFGLLAVMVHLLVGVHDDGFPVALDSPSRITLDFADAAIQDEKAIDALRTWDAEAGLGLVRRGADLDGDLRGTVFIPLNTAHSLPEAVGWYGDKPSARVVSPEVLVHTGPTGTYFLTGDSAQLSSFVAEVKRQGVLVTRDDASTWDGLQGLYRVKSLFIAFVTGCVLLATLVLYWLAVKSRSRALRVLGGMPVSRIQISDFGRLLSPITGVWLAVSLLAMVVIGLWKGWMYAPLFAAYLAALGGLMLVVVSVVALLMSQVSIPSPDLIARRQPATLGARRAAGGVKAVTFVLVLAAVGPAWVALKLAVGSAEQLSRWEQLADQVRVTFPGTSEADFQRLMPRFGAFVREAEIEDSVALSALFANDELAHQWASDALGERWSGFALVNERWLDLALTDDGRTSLVSVPREEVPRRFLAELAPQVDVWKRSDEPAERVLSGLDYWTPTDSPVSLIGSGGDLVHLDDVLVIVVPGTWATFNDSFLISSASGSQLLFTGLDKTQIQLESHGLARDIKIQYAAESGILRAQFAANEAWLSVVSMVGLAVALVVAAAISAYIIALLQARNVFARRLAGYPWLRVLQGRVALDVLLAAVLATAVAFLQPPDRILPVVGTAMLAVLVAPVTHVLAARRVFADVVARRL